MNIAYFDVTAGCAGDMLSASLIDAGLSMSALLKELAGIAVGGYRIETRKVGRMTGYGHPLKATVFDVTLTGGRKEHEVPYRKILRTIETSRVSAVSRRKMIRVFETLADAESVVHGETKEALHFHEVGRTDAIVEIATVVLGLEILGVKETYASAVGLGVSSPAVMAMANGMKTILTGARQETATPTGVAILKGLCSAIGVSSAMTVERSGFGAGMREDPAPNVVRFFAGTAGEADADRITVIETTIDDMNPVFFETAIASLFAAGALDVTLVPGQGKKNRPVFLLTVMVPGEKAAAVTKALFEETTTLGVRVRVEERIVLDRSFRNAATPWGGVPVKVGLLDGRIVNEMPEYEACKAIARRHAVPVKRVYQAVRTQGKSGGRQMLDGRGKNQDKIQINEHE